MKNKPTIKTKGRYQLQYRGVDCLNCGHPLDLSDKYCPNCSQANSTKKLTIADFFEEFFSNVLSYDSKLLQTLAALVLRPGKITREYIAGRRLSYTNPFRFLLSLAIVYFLLLGFQNNFEDLNLNPGQNSFIQVDLKKEIENIEFNNEAEKKTAMTFVDSLQLGKTISSIISKKDSTILSDPKKHFSSIDEKSYVGRLTSKIDFFKTLIQKDTLHTFKESEEKYGIPNLRENEIAFRLSKSFVKIEERPGSFFNSLISKLPFATFFFLPVFTVFILLVYIRKKYTYTDHLIFSFHNQSLLFILLIVSYLVKALLKFDSDGLFLLIFALYLYKAMRNFYQQGRIKTIIKYVFLNTVFFTLGCIGILLLIMASVFMY